MMQPEQNNSRSLQDQRGLLFIRAEICFTRFADGIFMPAVNHSNINSTVVKVTMFTAHANKIQISYSFLVCQFVGITKFAFTPMMTWNGLFPRNCRDSVAFLAHLSKPETHSKRWINYNWQNKTPRGFLYRNGNSHSIHTLYICYLFIIGFNVWFTHFTYGIL